MKSIAVQIQLNYLKYQRYADGSFFASDGKHSMSYTPRGHFGNPANKEEYLLDTHPVDKAEAIALRDDVVVALVTQLPESMLDFLKLELPPCNQNGNADQQDGDGA